MKKKLFVTLFFVLVIALSACSNGDLSTDANAPIQGGVPENQVPSQGDRPAQGAPPDGQQPPNQPPGGSQPEEPGAPQGDQLSGDTDLPQISQPESQAQTAEGAGNYAVVDSGQDRCYNDGSKITCPGGESAFYGQDAQYAGLQPSYTDNGDGTVSDLNTGLVWQSSPDTDGNGLINASDKLGWSQLSAYFEEINAQNYGGYNDWRLPSIKELYSLIDFSGVDPSGANAAGQTPFIDTNYFEFGYGDTDAGERIIDAQFATSTLYVSTTMNGDQTMFGVNFADGRIKGYGLSMRGSEKGFYVLAVRGNSGYGINDYLDGGNGAINDQATGLTWQQADSGAVLNWEGALAYCENLELAGYDDWRLPDAKELQSIVDYSRSPATTNSAAIDPLFSASTIIDEGGNSNYPFYWSSTTHINGTRTPGGNAVYVAFGEALGWMQGQGGSGGYTLMDVHGAGAQRSDPKSGDTTNWPNGHGPQGDVIRIDNYARCVRGGSQIVDVVASTSGEPADQTPAQNQPPADQAPAAGPGLGGEPPQEAIAACSTLAAQMSCYFTSPFGDTITGVCGQINEQLVCIPENGPPQ